MAALARHLEGKQDAARLKLKAAENNGAPPAHVLLVRAHIDLWDILQDPEGEAQRPLLANLRRDLELSQDLFLLPLRALAAQLAEDETASRDAANLLLRSAPGAAETFLTSALLFLRAGRFELAADELEDASRMDPRGYDASVLRIYVRWIEVLHDPATEHLEPGPGSEKPGLAGMQEALDARLRTDHLPAALLLRAVIHALGSRWEAAEEDLRRLERRTLLDRIHAGHERLQAFVAAGQSRSRLLEATAALQLHLGFNEAALATAELITGAELGADERRDLLRENHVRIARLTVSRESKALSHLEEALKLGTAAQDLRDDDELAPLRGKGLFEELLRRYEN